MEEKKYVLLKSLIALVLLLDLSAGVYLYLTNNNKNPNDVPLVEVDERNDNKLGVLEDTKAPELILQAPENIVYVGNDNYDVKPIAYDNYGKVEITYDTTAIDFDKAGTYELKVIATDKAGNQTSKVATITVAEKPKR